MIILEKLYNGRLYGISKEGRFYHTGMMKNNSGYAGETYIPLDLNDLRLTELKDLIDLFYDEFQTMKII